MNNKYLLDVDWRATLGQGDKEAGKVVMIGRRDKYAHRVRVVEHAGAESAARHHFDVEQERGAWEIFAIAVVDGAGELGVCHAQFAAFEAFGR